MTEPNTERANPELADEDADLIRQVTELGTDVWLTAAKWTREHRTLHWSRSATLERVGTALRNRWRISPNWAHNALYALRLARVAGFEHPSLPPFATPPEQRFRSRPPVNRPADSAAPLSRQTALDARG